MANTIKLKRGSGSDPSASDLSVGEIAIRTDEGKLFTKKDNGSVAEISGSGGINDGDKGDITVSNSGATFTIDNGVVTSAKIADGTIVNADISGSAAIAGSKIQAAGLVNAGVMTAAQNNKLAGIEDNATADMTGSEILSTISGENIILGEISSTGNSSFAGNITMSSSDGGSSAAPELDLYRISASPAAADYLGQIKFSGESADDSKEVYAKITGKIGDATSGSEDGIIEIAHRKAGSNNISARFTSTDLKLINGTGLEVAGDTTLSGLLSVSGTIPKVRLVDSNNNPDYELNNTNGVFNIRDTSNATNRFSINTDGHVDVTGNLDVGAGVDVTGNITVSGTVDGRDVASDGSKLDGIATGATNVTNTNQLTNGAGFLTSVGTSNISNNAVTFAKIEDIAQNRIIGRVASGSGDATTLTAANVRTMINVEDGATADQTASEILSLLSNQNITTTGLITSKDLILSDGSPSVTFTDSNNDPDFKIVVNSGVFTVEDTTNSADRFVINTDGHIDIGGNLDIGAGIDVTGDAAVSGSVTAPRISGSNGIIEMKQEIGTSQTLTSGYNAIAVDPSIANGVTITVPSGAVWSIV